MLSLKKIAITGGIASGKTTVCHILKRHAAHSFNSDQVIHQLLSQDKDVINQVTSLLGSSIIFDGKISKKKVAEIVFSDNQKLKLLETILHPHLFKRMRKEYERVSNLGIYRFFVAEMPLVQEVKKEKFFHAIIAILCDEERAKQRTNLAEEEYTKRMNHQWPIKKKAKYADYTIMNNGSIKELEQQVLNIIEIINE